MVHETRAGGELDVSVPMEVETLHHEVSFKPPA